VPTVNNAFVFFQDSIVDANEESQLKAAIAASLEVESRNKTPARDAGSSHNGRPGNGGIVVDDDDDTDVDSDDDLETFSDDDSQPTSAPGAAKGVVSRSQQQADRERVKRLSTGETLTELLDGGEATATCSVLLNGGGGSSQVSSASEDGSTTSEGAGWESHLGPSSGARMFFHAFCFRQPRYLRLNAVL
jgi:hypothetical protein